MSLPLISFIFPVFNEQTVIPRLYDEIARALTPLEGRYRVELIFVNDGSGDASLALLQDLLARDERVRILNFSRNFGHQAAITAGLDYAQGDAAVVMDSDLQDPPAVALELIRAWESGAYDVVYATRRTRKEGWFKQITADLFYRLFASLSEVSVPRNTGDFRLLDRRVIEVMRRLREKNRYMRGLTSFVGFRQTAILFDRPNRLSGETKYPLRKMLTLALNAIFSFSTVPLKAITYLGFIVCVLSLLGILYALWMKLFFPEITVSGWTFMIIAIFFIGGIQMLSLGVIGAYIGKIYTEAQDRPIYIVADVFGGATHPDA